MDIHRLQRNLRTRQESPSVPIKRGCPVSILRGIGSGALMTTAVVAGACAIIGCSGSDDQAGSVVSAGPGDTNATGKGGTTSTSGSTGIGGGSGGTTTEKTASSATIGTGGNVPSGGSGGSGGAQAKGGAAVDSGDGSGGSAETSTKSAGGGKAAGGSESAGGTKAAGGSKSAGGGKATGGSESAGGTKTAGGSKSAGSSSTSNVGGAKDAAGGAAAGGTESAGGTTSSNGGATASGGSSATAGAKATSGAGGTGTSACNAADKKPDPTPVSFTNPGSPPSGSYKVTIEHDPGISDHTVYRPTDLGALGATKLPIIAWGEGGCVKNGTKDFAEILSEFTSYGFLILADGPPNGTGAGANGSGSDATPLIKAIDWAVAENQRPCSQYYQKLDTSKVAVMGQSCGGLMAFAAAGDPRITTAVAWNSGLISPDQKIYKSLHAPMAIIDGGSDDMAYKNGANDFAQITSIPLMFANYPYGHFEWFPNDNGGEFGKAGVAWLRWQLLGDVGATGKGMFLGANCGLCNTKWDIQTKNMQ